ncbi:MAG: hypothetical protein ABIJ52_03280 [Pseudomonadota bacterium]
MWINKKIIDTHQQIFNNSCVPSGVEMILKLEGIMNPNSYLIQETYGDNSRSGDDFDNKIFANVNLKIKFHKILLLSLADIINKIDSELNDNRYVLIPLKTSPDGDPNWTCHVHLVYDFAENGEYKNVTKLPGVPTRWESNTKARFTANFNQEIKGQRRGIDFLVYERL